MMRPKTQRMANRAKSYAHRALCEEEEDLCLSLDNKLEDIELQLQDLDDR